MRSLLAVFQRELVERRLILAVALLAGTVPFLIALLPGTASLGAAELRSGTALVIAGLLSAFLALALGSSMIARDLGERRLGFYFGRPLPGWSIWGGKLAAALLVLWTSAALVLLPVVLSGDLVQQPITRVLSALVMGGPFLLLAAHALQVMVRARSRWLLLDLAAPLGLALLAWTTYSRLRDAAVLSYPAVPFAFAAALLLALFAGSTVQTIRGRTDLRQSHRLLSLGLWGTAAALFLGIAGWGSWVLAAGPRDLAGLAWVQGAPKGSWVALSGYANRGGGHQPGAFFDTASGRSIPTGPASRYRDWSRMAFTGDGKTAFWLRFEKSRPTLYRADLTDLQIRPIPVVANHERTSHITVSPDGRFLVARQSQQLIVEDLETHRLAAIVPLSAGHHLQMAFPEPRRLRLFLPHPATTTLSSDESSIEVQDLVLRPDADAEVVPVTRLSPASAHPFSVEESPDGEHLLVQTEDPEAPRATLTDLRSGRTLRFLPTAGRAWFYFLADGRIAKMERTEAEVRLDLLQADGSWLQGFRFPGYRQLWLGGQPKPGVLAGALGAEGHWQGFYLHLDERRLQPLGAVSPASRPRNQADAARLFLRESGGLIRIDPESGARHAVLPRVQSGDVLAGWMGY